MRKILVLLPICFCFLFPTNAQTLWGGNAGLNVSNISNARENNVRPLVTFQFSGLAIVPIGNSLAMQPSFGFREKGYKIKNTIYSDSVKGEMKVRYRYLQLSTPVLLRCNANDSYRLYAGGGPYLAYLINGKRNESNLNMENSHRLDLGLNLSFLLIIHRHWTMAMASDLGFISPNKFTNSTNINSGITLGYVFH
jgi:hypothetical protein